jgi:type II secretory pathway pseudopilin PulG
VNRKSTERNRCGGLTLAEMLVVVLIIVILAGLITAAGYRAVRRAKIAKINTEIQQLSMALEQYKQKFGEYPPDFSGDLTSTNVQAAILRHISHAFPRFTSTWIGGTSYPVDWTHLQQEILANSNNLVDLSKMTPASALVFWLGGIPDAQGRLCGFSKNPADPFENPSTTPSRIGPFYDFDPSRLTMKSGSTENNGKFYPSGVPVSAGQPYVYFRAEQGQPEQKREYFIYDGSAYTFKCWPVYPNQSTQPYWDQRTMGWVNSTSFQILCSGLDCNFGKENVYPTGLVPDWTSISSSIPADVLTDLKKYVVGTDSTGFPAGNYDHADDQTNFTPGTIGDDLP